MKTKNLLILTAIFALTSSCMPDFYYQVYRTNPDEEIETKSNTLVYEDQYCKVTYNLWQQNGNIGFVFYNKTNDDLNLNLDESFFIINEMAYPYYQNRIFGTASNFQLSSASNYTYLDYLLNVKTNTVGATSSSEYSVSRIERKVLTVPSKTSIKIAEFSINNELIRNCDLYKYPKKKEIKTAAFNKSNSPLVFSNRISYSLENSSEPIEIENSFYVSGITNYPENEMFDTKDEEFCGEKSVNEIRYSKEEVPNKFYIKYPAGNSFSSLKH
jgi:hypothetical protein